MNRHIFLLNITLFSLSIIFAVLSVVWVNIRAVKGYEIRDLEKRVSILKEENKQSEISLTQLRSLEHISKNVPILGMVKIETPVYINSQVDTFALGK
ncbi:hypothetical protein CO172_03380 [Candidatus Uhrbacteria bacterium CG_4_9_14_3_um_filter_36_7]|uniref:Cell division protein FtsL n=1 Tax=Candidatus Uhrbacteria bacterium CG_4_9_14_3_um_filter_36_7 TaxID=1975033 RepID=A0A2M7XGI9_9BACT|nr:MAG: hypothetical protein CO172_03380 [Candidatus Uhrbacteria bacterium CG_4_9_14_3_um_filter_36_7]